MSTKPLSQTHRPSIRSLACLLLASLLIGPASATAQDWGAESEDDWSSNPSSSTGGQSSTGPSATGQGSRGNSGFSLRAGIGFTADPDTYLMNFELPYAFDQWVSVGPMFQIGVEDETTIVAPTINVAITVPDLPGEDFDKIHPYGFLGMGFAWIEKDNRRGQNDDEGFLIDFGFGVEYEINEQIFVGSQMTFNFLPDDTLGEKFFFSWQMVGLRYAF